MDTNGQVQKPMRIELGVRNTTDEHVVALLAHYKDMEVPVVNTNVNEEYKDEIVSEFYDFDNVLIDVVGFPYWEDLSAEMQAKLMEQMRNEH